MKNIKAMIVTSVLRFAKLLLSLGSSKGDNLNYVTFVEKNL